MTHVLMLVHMSAINKQMRARPGGRDAQLAHLWQEQGTRGWTLKRGGPSWGTTACLSYSANLVFVRSGRVRTCAHMDTHTNTHTSHTPNPQRLISVSDKLEHQVHSALHNKSISRVIEFHQSLLPPLRPAGSVPRAPQRSLPRDCTTVIIQLHSFLPS